MNTYELTLVLNSKMVEKEKENLLTKVYSLVEKEGGKITEKKNWGKKILSYEIKKCKEGFFEYIIFSLNPAKIITIDKKIRVEENIIRYLLIKMDDR